MLVTREQPSFQAPFEGHSSAVHKNHQAKRSRLLDPAQQMLGGQQWRAGVVAPPSVDAWLTGDVACLQHRGPMCNS